MASNKAMIVSVLVGYGSMRHVFFILFLKLWIRPKLNIYYVMKQFLIAIQFRQCRCVGLFRAVILPNL